MKWYDATLDAVKEIVTENNSPFLTYKEIKEKKLANIVVKTKTTGKTPENSLSLYLQKLRDAGKLKFVDNRGQYFFIDNSLDESYGNIGLNMDFSSTDEIEVDEIIYQTKIRKGQNTLRNKVLKNYQSKCAFCGIMEPPLLIASHIYRWSDDKHGDYRGKLNNIICMCEIHDALFELGYFTINEQFQIINNYKGDDEIVKKIINKTQFTPPLQYPPSSFCINQHHKRIGLK